MWSTKQGLALRGHDETENSKNKGNFLELIDFQSECNQTIQRNFKQTFSYLIPTIQNEMIGIIAGEIIKIILPQTTCLF